MVSIKPNFSIIANGKDITKSLEKKLVSLSVTDNQKDQADQLSMAFDGKFQRPFLGDELRIYIGWGEQLDFVGLFFVNKTTLTNNRQLSIEATGINFSASFKERRTLDYSLNLGDVVRTIAARHRLDVKTDMGVGKRFEQHDESDMAFLNRLAKEYNAIFNVKNNTIYMMKKAVQVPSITIDIDKAISSEINHESKTFYHSCKAIFHDTKLNKITSETVGSGKPVLVKQGKWLNRELAKEAAINALARANQGTSEGNISIMGKVVFAGSELNLDGEKYEVTRVTQSLSRTWTTEVEFKKSTV